MTETNSIYHSIRPRYPELADRVAVVTGSSRGIGKGIARRLAREGMKVVIHGRNRQAVEETAGELRAWGADVLAVPADLSQSGGVARLFDETLTAYGTVDLLVNNAADLRRFHFFEVDEGLLDYQLAANVRAPYLCAQRAAEVMRAAGGGSIIHISSVGAVRAHWRGLPYDVTKGAIDAMTRAMALELAEFGIRVNAIAPGPIYTRGTPSMDNPHLKAVAGRVPLGRFGSPLEIGAAVAFLASPDASYITGAVLYVDAGLTAQLSPRDQPV